MFKPLPGILVLLLLALLAGVAVAQDSDMMGDLPSEVAFAQPGIMPEGVEWDAAHERFLVGSLTTGTIYAIADDGTIEPFIEDDELASTVGIEIDEANNRLLVTNSDASVFSAPDATGMAGLAAYDLDTGERLFMVDLSDLYVGRHFANDVTVDDAGNAYVTDSFSPVIYQVTPEGEAEIYAQSDLFANEFIGLNGIEYIPSDGDMTAYLLAAVTGSASIYKIPLGVPAEVTQVIIDEPFGADGMALLPDGSIAAVASFESGQEIVIFSSEDDFETASIGARTASGGSATTLAIRDGAIFFVNAYLINPAQEEYQIVHAEFEDMAME
ncbi:MAG: SMP-30/gluconolactonase/LRE family protein [Anaerolineae bacterium]|nr:SMP-30/gluconolactonase/LRE family protein [Anaerolineae bacterium]